MALRDAVIRAGVIPSDQVEQKTKKRYSEMLSHELAIEVSDGRNPHAMIGEDADEGEVEFEDTDPEGAVETEEE